MSQGGELMRQGLRPLPIGTLQEVKDAGYDPSKVASCSRGNMGEVRGCPLWGDCRFDQADMGGFKGKSGPRNIGFRITTLDGNDQMITMPCYTFVRVMQARMDWGNTQMLKGRPHETIRIAGQEGDTLKQIVAVNENYKPGDTSGLGVFVDKVVPLPVKPFPRPGQHVETGFAAEIRRMDEEYDRRQKEAQKAMGHGSFAAVPEEDGGA